MIYIHCNTEIYEVGAKRLLCGKARLSLELNQEESWQPIYVMQKISS